MKEEVIIKAFTAEEVAKASEIMNKVLKEGFEKVADELIFDPDYLGEKRATVELLDRAELAVMAALDLTKRVKNEIYKNI